MRSKTYFVSLSFLFSFIIGIPLAQSKLNELPGNISERMPITPKISAVDDIITDTPNAGGGPIIPLGYELDANDYFVLFYADNYQVQINDGEVQEYKEPYDFKFHREEEDGVQNDLYFGIKVLKPGKFEVQIGIPEGVNQNVTLSIVGQNGILPGEPTPLHTGDKITMTADSLSALFYEGEEILNSETKVDETLSLVDREILYTFSQKAGSDLYIRPKSFVEGGHHFPTPQPTPEPKPTPDPTESPIVIATPDANDDVSNGNGGGITMRGGGGRLFSCNLHPNSIPSTVGLLMSLGLSLGGLIGLRSKSKLKLF